ncbi:glutamate racemase [Roseofilum casamattae]|uniref:Glutamate racemase n=1 Tax=Roseofilum casamattae BLCC-M143 TaxID=3022442 RepID=A0ABT7BZA4_9CYAN|nr:glutamate racemase [Roseofilum casamattae]MDJ1184541.1 glutamate racemase [Roseofilum casamattae BLCC-M143]
MSMDRRPIGVFDSGVGGLTVLSEMYRQLPQESIVYFADTARLPYGTRSPAEIIQFVREIMTWMEQQEVKMVVMACNTSNALALEEATAEFSTPVLGLILPAARAAVALGNRVGVIATPATAASQAYRKAALEVDPTVQVWQVGCPEFVPLIEQNRINDAYTYEVARSYLQPLLQQNIDTLIYGCTHYPLLEPVIRQLLPKSVQVVNPAVHVVKATARELELLGVRNPRSAKPTRFAVSGAPERFATSALAWLGYTPQVERVHLAPLHSSQPLSPMPLSDLKSV